MYHCNGLKVLCSVSQTIVGKKRVRFVSRGKQFSFHAQPQQVAVNAFPAPNHGAQGMVELFAATTMSTTSTAAITHHASKPATLFFPPLIYVTKHRKHHACSLASQNHHAVNISTTTV